MKITLLRHAQVQEEYIGKYNGHIDIPLSKQGKEQAKKVAKELQDENYDGIYCSDLLRTRQTLQAFDIKVQVTFTKALREKSWGIHEGKSFQEIENSGLKYINFEQWINALDGQDIQSYQAKAIHYFKNTILQSKHKNILIVSHGGFIRSLLSHYKNITFEESFSIKIDYATFLYFNNKNKSFYHKKYLF